MMVVTSSVNRVSLGILLDFSRPCLCRLYVESFNGTIHNEKSQFIKNSYELDLG